MPPSAESLDFAYIPLTSLRFDPQNPRFPTSIDGQQIEVILQFMLQDAGLLDLMGSIAKQGFFPGEPLLVAPNPLESDTWLVVEGNRRLAACTLLAEPSKAPTKKQAVMEIANNTDLSRIDPIPCLKFQSREGILRHLGYRHVTGIKEWDPLAKARFLNQQYSSESGSTREKLRSVARSIGSRADYVGRLLTAFRLYQTLEEHDYFDIPNLSETSIDFSLIPSVLAYENVTTYLGLASSQDLEMPSLSLDRWQFICRFIFERDVRRRTRLGESRNIRQLANILADERGRPALESGATLSQAQQLMGGGEGAFRSFVQGAEQNLRLAQSEMEGVSFDSDDVEALERIRRSAAALRNAVQERIDESE